MKYFGFETKQEFIEAIEEGELWIYYKKVSYIFTLDGRGWNCMIDDIYDESLGIERDTTFSADTIEDLIKKVILYDGTVLSEVLEMDTEEI